LKIYVQQIGFSDYKTEFYNTCRLFYEQVELVYEQEQAQDADLYVSVELLVSADKGEIAAEACLTHLSENKIWCQEAVRRHNETWEDPRRIERRAILSALLQVFQEATGLEQPWGILTGVRPTKLAHNLLMKEGKEKTRQFLQEHYLVTRPKADLLMDIAERQLKVIPDLFHLDHEVSLYIGIPYCPTKCAYCTFPAYDIRGNNGSVHAFLEGLHEEIRLAGEWLKRHGMGITTIYWGGGTPTSLEAEDMDTLFRTMQKHLPQMDKVRELTVEAGRPDTITPDKLGVMKRWDVDRISINPQSFTQLTLDAIGRHHTVKETVDKFKLSRQLGMNNINMDLIIGLPGEGVAELEATLEETAKLLPESLTVHTLSFKRASKMTKQRDQYEVAGRREIAVMMQKAVEWTKQHQYVPYYLYRQKNILGNLENVGYSLEGKESLYNIVMMEERQTILGLGCGAVSKILFPEAEGKPRRIERFPNPKEPSVYNDSWKQYVLKKHELLDQAYSKNRRQE